MPMTIQHVHIKSKDPKQAAQFYMDNLGATLKSEITGRGCQLDLHGLQLNVTGIVATQSRQQNLGIEHIAVDTDAEVEVTQKGQTYNLDTEGVDTIQLDAAKLTHASSYDEEDRQDAAAWQDITAAKKRTATSNLAVLYDNLALGVTGAVDYRRGAIAAATAR